MKRFIISISISLLFVSLGFDTSVVQAQPRRSLHQAAVDGDADRIKKLLAEGADVNEKESKMGYAPLHGAARNGRKAVVELLLGKGADINLKEKSNKTALYLAAEYGQKEIVELLIAKGADINAMASRGENALSIAQKKRMTDIVQILLAKGATDPVAQNRMGDGYYDEEGMFPGGAGPAGRQRGAAPPAVEIDLLADPNKIAATLKTFDGLEKEIVALSAKSATEMKYWASNRTDNRSSVARTSQKQVEDELALLKKIAVEEKATKTTEAIDALVKQRKNRYLKVNRELLQQRREALQSESSRTTGGQPGGRTSGRTSSRTSGRTSGRSSRGGRYSSGRQGAAGIAGSGGYDDGRAYGRDTGDRGRPSRPTRPGEQLDPATEDAIRQWTQATMDNKSELAKTLHPRIHAEFAMIRRTAVEEEAKKTTAAIDGILLARQVRFNVYIRVAETLKRTAIQGQDPRMAGRYGEETGRTSGRRSRTTRGGTTGTQQQGGRTRRR